MRLIFGIWKLDGDTVAPQQLELMCEAMQSPFRRGTSSIWMEGSVGLGVLDFGKDVPPPFAHSATSSRTAADIRLDNAGELRSRLGLPAAVGLEQIAAAALEEARPEIARRMLGDFAVALWSRDRHRLLLIRDALGIRPLVYHYHPGAHFLFASFPAGIFGSGLVRRALDEAGLARVVLRSYIPDGTLFRDVRQVPAGHMVELTRDGLRQQCYWSPRPQPVTRMSRQEAAEHLRHTVQHAVEHCLNGPGPVASHLSGGLDSSAITVLAARVLRQQNRRLFAYSFLADAWPGHALQGEEPFVEAVLQQEPGIAWKPVHASMPAHWINDRYYPDAPLSLSDDAAENVVCADAGSHGASMVLSGWGGDEAITFNGRGALAAAFRSLRWHYLFSEAFALRRERGFSLLNTFKGDVFEPLLPPALMLHVRRIMGRPSRKPLEPELLHPEILRRLSGNLSVPMGSNPAENQANLLQAGHVAYRANTFAMISARYGMAFGFPLLNRDVVDFALSLPATWHIQGGWKRSLFRDAMGGVLPETIRWRHTKLVSLPRAAYEFARQKALLERRTAALEKNPLISRLFDLDRIRDLLRKLPRVESVQNPALEPALEHLPSLAHTLECAFYVEQQFSDGHL